MAFCGDGRLSSGLPTGARLRSWRRTFRGFVRVAATAAVASVLMVPVATAPVGAYPNSRTSLGPSHLGVGSGSGSDAGSSATTATTVDGTASSTTVADDGGAAELAEDILTPLRVYLLIDESGSLTDADVTREREVAAAVPATLFPGSTVSIWGFGSAPVPGAQAVTKYCSSETIPETGTAAVRDRLSACAGQVHRRADNEGNDTDYHAALRAVAEEEQRAVASRPKAKPGDAPPPPGIVVLLTDGRLDVKNVQEYGTDPAARQAQAEQRITAQVLPEFQKMRLQLWPFGYGEVDKAALDRLAAGAFGPNPACVTASKPVATVAGSREAVVGSVLGAFRSARCAGGSETAPTGTSVPTGTRDFPLDIPVTASVASIVVVKGDPKATVAFIDPKGRDVTTKKEIDGQELEATNSELQSSVRVTLPVPGRWIARVKTPATATFLADATWVGQVATNIDTEPYAPLPGDDVVVQFRLNTRSKVDGLKDAAKGLNFKASIQVGKEPPKELSVNDSGKSGDRVAGDLEYSGTFKMPTKCEKNVDVQVVGTVDAVGLQGDTRPKYLVCSEAKRDLVASVERTPTKPLRLYGNESLEFEVAVSNDGEPVELDLGVQTNPAANIKVTPPRVKAGTGSSQSTHKLVVGEVTKPERTEVVLRVRQDGKTIEEETFELRLDVPPSFCEKFPCVPAAIAFALVIAGVVGFVVFRKARYAKAQQMRGLTARTRSRVPNDFEEDAGGQIVRPPAASSLEWKFAVDQGSIIRPDDTADDSRLWTVRRGEGSQVRSHIKVRRPMADARDDFAPTFATPAAAPVSDDPWETVTLPVTAPADDPTEVAVGGDWELHSLPATFQIDDEFDLVIQNAPNSAKSRR